MATSPVFAPLPASLPVPPSRPAAAAPLPASTPRPTPVIRTAVHSASTGVSTRSARRHITPEAGFALTVLGHAIEYLADEYVHAAGSLPSVHNSDPRLEAIQILMAANRQVYYESPIVPSLVDRLRQRLFGSR